MFGEKYSRLTFWIWSILLLIPYLPLITLSRGMGESSETADKSLIFGVLALILGIIQLNTLANRIRDYGSNPWLSLLALVPLVNIGLALYYGIVKSKKKLEEQHKAINDADLSTTKVVSNHAEEVIGELNPMAEKCKESYVSAQLVNEEHNITSVTSINDDELYEQVMLEIEEDNKIKATWARALSQANKIKATWARALSQANGDLSKAEALYIQFRVKAIKLERETELEIKLKERLAVKEESDRLKKEENESFEEMREKKLSEFLLKNNMEFNKKISANKVKTNIKGSIFDSYLEYDGVEWKLSDKILYADDS